MQRFANELKKINQVEAEYNQTVTNADRIRQMTDEELAEWLTRITDDAQLDARTRCDYQWDEWLKEEVEEKDE